MNKLKILLYTFLLLIILPITAKADCRSDFNKIEDKFKVTYEYNKDTDDFTLTFVNPDREKYAFFFESLEDAKNAKVTLNGQTLTFTLEHLKKEKYNYGIDGIYEGCKTRIKTETKMLYKYNHYANSPLCEGNEEFALCQKDYDKEIDDETFKSRLDTYVKSKEQEKTIEDNTDNKQIESNSTNLIKNIIDYINENIIKVIVVAIFIIIIVIAIILKIKSEVKSRRLE